MRLFTGKAFAVVLAMIALGAAALFISRYWWMPAAAAQHAALLDRQLNWALIDSGVAFLVAQLVLAALVWKFRDTSGRPAKSFPGSVRIAILIGSVFIGLELFSAATLGRSAWASMYAPIGGDVVQVQAMGQQFAFYFRYPGPDGKFGPTHVDKIDASIGNYFGLDRVKDSASKDDVVSAELVLPVNRPVELLLDSQDVTHSFYVRELRVQQDMVPGMRIPVHFTPTKVGRYEIACSQLCGLGHYRMRAFLRVLSESDFQSWIETHRQ